MNDFIRLEIDKNLASQFEGAKNYPLISNQGADYWIYNYARDYCYAFNFKQKVCRNSFL